MSGHEIVVVIIGLFAGYWVVSFFGGGARGRTRSAESSSTHSEARESGADDGHEQPKKSWPQILELPAEAGVEEIRSAYRRLVSLYHPDKVASLGPELQALANLKSQQIIDAYRDALRERGAAE